MNETIKSLICEKCVGFMDKFFKGCGLDIGNDGDLMVSNAKCWDFEAGGARMPATLQNTTFELIYSTHR